jgi:hypothetical protein
MHSPPPFFPFISKLFSVASRLLLWFLSFHTFVFICLDCLDTTCRASSCIGGCCLHLASVIQYCQGTAFSSSFFGVMRASQAVAQQRSKLQKGIAAGPPPIPRVPRARIVNQQARELLETSHLVVCYMAVLLDLACCLVCDVVFFCYMPLYYLLCPIAS